MFLAGFAKQKINHGEGCTLGGYWGNGKCSGIHDNLYCKVTCIASESTSAGVSAVEQGHRPLVIVSFDLIGISAEFARKCQYHAAEAVNDFLGIAPATTDLSGIVVACTHTHTGPQTNEYFIGMGHASEQYMDSLLNAVLVTTRAALETRKKCRLRHVKTDEINDVAVNRRQRQPSVASVNEEVLDKLMWFEKSGQTKLGQRFDGPKVPYAEALVFEDAIQPLSIHGIIVCYAMHPTCNGMKTLESSDYCGFVCQYLEKQWHTNPMSMYLNGCCGDVNPIKHRSGYHGARMTGQYLGQILHAAIHSSM